MNRTLTVEIKDIPDEVWEFMVNVKGSVEAADDLIKEMITERATVAIVAFYEIIQAHKAGIPLDSMIPKILEDIVGDAFEPSDVKDVTMLEGEKHLSKFVERIKEKDV